VSKKNALSRHDETEPLPQEMMDHERPAAVDQFTPLTDRWADGRSG
jgi:hypothetical protein